MMRFDNTNRWIVFFLGLGLGVVAMRTLMQDEQAAPTVHSHAETDGEDKQQLYMCPMMCIDPRPEPGRCPVCGMDLVPVTEETGGDAGPHLVMSERARKLAEVQTVPVQRKFAAIDLRLSGKVAFDETRVREISAWVPGRLEEIFVDQTGTRVRENDPLVEIYSPELNAEKATYLATIRGDRSAFGPDAEENPDAWLAAVRSRLLLRGMTKAQIDALEKKGEAGFLETITAPIGGTVIHKAAMAGMHVEVGTHLYTVADLSRVWVWLDAYESDLPLIRYGQRVAIRTASYGDRVFRGWISFIEPVLNENTRATRVRVIVDNQHGALKPNMFVRARIAVRVGAKGQVVPGKDLSGKWISPRHPEIIRDNPGDCPVCGIDLIRAEDLGYATGENAQAPLVVPASAVLYTGTRSVVYRRVPGQANPTFEPITVHLGPRVGEQYVILDGLAEGDVVVTQGAFKIDSALQLGGQPSMMRPAPAAGPSPAAHARDQATGGADAAFRAALAEATEAYFALQQALGKDDAQAAKANAAAFRAAILAVPLEALTEEEMTSWTTHGIGAYKTAGSLAKAEGLAVQRTHFRTLSASMEALVRRFGPLPGITAHLAFCPMAFDNKGAQWLQATTKILNPYEGSRMPACGTIQERLWEEPHE